MPRIHFGNDEIDIEVVPGTALPQAAAEAESTLPFACRAGTCGACVLQVVRGQEGLDPPGHVEDDTLHVLGLAHPDRRLGCQIILREADLAVRWSER